jgi:hypothetical protein
VGAWSALIGRVPEGDATAERLWIVDVAKARQVLGLAAPAAGASAAELARDALALNRAGVASPSRVLASRAAGEQPAVRAEIGFGAADVDRVVQAGEVPGTVEVVEGRIEPAQVDAAVHADPVWSGSLQTATHAGVSYFTWGDDGAVDVKKVTPFRPVGESLRLAVSSGHALVAQHTADMEKLLDVGRGTAPAVTAVPEVARVVTRFEREPVYAAFVGRPGVSEPPPGASSTVPSADRVIGSAVGKGTDGTFLLMLVPMPDAATAAAKKTAVETMLSTGTSLRTNQKWTELFTSTSVTVEDTMVVVRVSVPPARAAMWSSMLLARDSLVGLVAS